MTLIAHAALADGAERSSWNPFLCVGCFLKPGSSTAKPWALAYCAGESLRIAADTAAGAYERVAYVLQQQETACGGRSYGEIKLCFHVSNDHVLP